MNHASIRKPSRGLFTIIFEGRTGSSFIVSCLNSHPNVLCYPEILADSGPAVQKKLLKALIEGRPIEAINPKVAQPRYFHGDVNGKTDLQRVGFKTKLNQIGYRRLEAFHYFLERHRFKLIYLKRRNIVKSVLSLYNAERLRKKYRSSNAENEHQIQGPIYIDPERFIQDLERREKLERAHEKFYQAFGLDKQIFYYEDLIQSQNLCLSHLLAFLGVKGIPLKGKFLKNTPDSLCDAVLNYEEFHKRLSGTRFEHCLEK